MQIGWIAAAYALGILAADRGVLGADAAAVLLVQACWLALLCARLPRARGALALGIAGLAGAHGFASQGAALPGAGPVEATLEARVAARRGGPQRQSLTLAGVRAVDGPALPERMLLGLEGGPPRWPGERLRARVRARPPVHRFNPGSADPARRLARRGVGAVGRPVEPRLVVALGDGGSPRARLAARRADAAARLAGAGPAGPLVAALALGERRDLPPADADVLRRLGLAHVLAVSGLHLGLAGGLAYGCVLAVLRRRRLAARRDVRRAALVAALGAASLYALLCGFAVPVQRASVFLLAVVAANGLRRAVRPHAALALAALAVLAAEPAALFAAGAQLSFAASAGLLAVRRPPGSRGPVALLDTSAAALAATAPLVAHHFATASPVGLVANLVAVPWLGFALLPACLAAGVAAVADPASPLASGLGALAEGLAGLTLAAAHGAVASLPGRGPAAASPGVAGTLLAAGLAVAALRQRSSVLRVLLVVAEVWVLAALPPPGVAPAPPRVVFLDVGQGDATLVQGHDAAVLVDGGGAHPGGFDAGRAVIVPALRALGVRRLELVVVSHADLDHRGGLASVLDALPVGRLWLPHGGLGDPAFGPLLERARGRGVVVAERGLGDAPLRRGGLTVQPLWPPREAPGRGDNDRSLVVRVDLAGTRVLLPGDLEAAAEGALAARVGSALRAEVLKLPHHGSASSSSPAFLAAVGPRLAVASAPCRGRFAMPAAEVRAALEAAGTSLWWTGRDGAVLVGVAGPLVARGYGPAGGVPGCWGE